MPNSKVHRRNQLVERHLDLALRLARSFSQRTGLDQDDLFQVAVLGLIKATKTYRSATNVPFEAFARTHARGAILHYYATALPWFDCHDALRKKRNGCVKPVLHRTVMSSGFRRPIEQKTAGNPCR